MGAEVTKIEPPEGDAARGHGAFAGAAPDAETSALFLHLNANKRSVTLNTGSATGRAILDRLAAASDVLVYDAPELSDAAPGATVWCGSPSRRLGWTGRTPGTGPAT